MFVIVRNYFQSTILIPTEARVKICAKISLNTVLIKYLDILEDVRKCASYFGTDGVLDITLL